MNKYRKHLAVTLVLNIILATVMPKLCHAAYVERGYEWQYGGEWLVPIFVIIAILCMLFGERE